MWFCAICFWSGVSFFRSRRKRERQKTIKPLLDAGVLSNYMGDTLTGSGLEWRHLEAAVRRDWDHGIRDLFTEPLPGPGGDGDGDATARVTSSKKIIQQVTEYFHEYLQLHGENVISLIGKVKIHMVATQWRDLAGGTKVYFEMCRRCERSILELQ